MKADVYSITGEVARQVDLPSVFNERVRPDLINRAGLALRSARYQPKGTMVVAGLQTSAEYIGRRRAYRTMINVGSARLPQVKLAKGRRGEVRKVPQARTGRRAHPPKPEKILVEKINKKEKRKAIRSAIAATADVGLATERGHRVGNIKKLPIIVDNAFEALKKTKEVREALLRLKLGEDLKRGEQKKIRAGRGTTRGRKYKKKKSVLIVVGSDKGVVKASKSIAGVDVSLAKNINADLLAPGGKPGRLTVYTESALSEIGKLFG